MITVIENNIKNLNVKDNKIEIITKSKKPNEVDIEKIYNEVHKDAVDAYFTQEPLAVFPSENGIDFDISIEDAKKLLNESEKETTYSTYSLSVHGLFQCTVCISSRNKRNRCRYRSDSGS